MLLDDSIMNYKYLHDKQMPECFYKSLSRVRCLLRFYKLLKKPNYVLMEDTWQAVRNMGLVQNESDVIPVIKKEIENVYT